MINKDKYSFDDLLEIVEVLRGENGCPWDREQTHESLKNCFIEETYEVLEAIDLKDNGKITEELGDVLLQVVFHSSIAKQEDVFDIDDVITGICRKLISRHTHIFGDDNIDNSKDVLKNWEKIKKNEKGFDTQTEVLEAVPKNFPALMRSTKVQQKAAQVGFDWDDTEDVFKKVREEVDELYEAYKKDDIKEIEDEAGDLFFAAVNLSRFLGVSPESSLTVSTDKFIKRFSLMEKIILDRGMSFKNMTLEQMDKVWEEVKLLQREDDNEN